jgi:hypothetical protein
MYKKNNTKALTNKKTVYLQKKPSEEGFNYDVFLRICKLLLPQQMK